MRAFDPARVAPLFAEGTSAIRKRHLEETGRPPEEDVEWTVDLPSNGLEPRSRG